MKVTVDTTVKVKAIFTVDGKQVEHEFNVTVRAYPM